MREENLFKLQLWCGNYAIVNGKDYGNSTVHRIFMRDDQWPCAETYPVDGGVCLKVIGNMEFHAFVEFMCRYGAELGWCTLTDQIPTIEGPGAA